MDIEALRHADPIETACRAHRILTQTMSDEELDELLAGQWSERDVILSVRAA